MIAGSRPHTGVAVRIAADTQQPSALLIVPTSGVAHSRDALETMLQGLALPTHHPWLRRLDWGPHNVRGTFALELIGSAQSQAFAVRAAHPELLTHLATQLQSQLPNAHVIPIPPDLDPFALRAGEEVTVYELRRGAAEKYLPLRVNSRHYPVGNGKLEDVAADPLLGLLATLSKLPPETRLVLQLAATAAPEEWSRGYLRAADQYSLYQSRDERRRQQQERSLPEQGETALTLILMLLALAGVALYRKLHPIALPGAAGLVAVVLILALGLGACVLALSPAPQRRLYFRMIPRSRRTPMYDPGLVAQKTQRVAYQCVLRLYAISPAGTGNRAARSAWRAWRQQSLDQVTAAYRQFHSADAGYFKPHLLWGRMGRRLLPRIRSVPGGLFGSEAVGSETAMMVCGSRSGWTSGVNRSGHLLTVAEMATLWHLPDEAALTHIPFLQDTASWHSRLAPRTLATYSTDLGVLPEQERFLRMLAPVPSPSSGLPNGTVSPPGNVVLGTSRHGTQVAEVALPPELLARHTLAIGGTGKGKSSLLLALACSWLRAGSPEEPPRGLVLLDPHGDLASSLLKTLPTERREDVRVLDLADTAYPFGLNPLDVTVGRNRDKTCEDLMAIFEHIWESSWGYRMEDIWKASLKTLFEANETLVRLDPRVGPYHQYTLVDVPALLTLKPFRRMVLSQIEDSDLTLWWQRFATWDMRLQHDATLPVLNKVGNFGGSKVARRVLGQSRTTIDLASALRAGQIIVVNTAQQVVGPDTSALVGATIVGLVQAALGEQAHLAEADRVRTLVVIDEFQAIPGADYAGLLGELRKFGGVFVLATQSLAQLDRLGQTLRASVLGNVGNLFAFGMSAEDAHKIAPELDGTVTEQDLINLADHTCYARLTQHGQRLRTFSLALSEPTPGVVAQEEDVRAHSRSMVGRPQALVEEMLARASRRRLTLGQWSAGSGVPASPFAGDAELLPEEEPDTWISNDAAATGGTESTAEPPPETPPARPAKGKGPRMLHSKQVARRS